MAHPPFYSTGTGFLYRDYSDRAVKLSTHLHLVEVVHSPPFSSELTNEWSYTSAPLYAFMAWRGTILPLSVCYVSFWQDVLM